MVDLHSHVLPGIDDGPRTLGESVSLARMLAAEGVTRLAATPHLRADHPGVVPSELAGRANELSARLADEGIGIEIIPAGEVDIVWALDADRSDLNLVSYGQRGSDLLVECPYGLLTSFFEEQLFQLTVRGYRVLLAHPERNPSFQAEPDRLRSLVDRGVLVQVTAASLAGSPRKSASVRAAVQFARSGLAHVIASDAHGMAAPGREAITPGLEAGRRLVGERADWMVKGAPNAIVDGDVLPDPPPVPARLSRRRPFLR